MRTRTLAEPVVCAGCGAGWPDPGPRFCGGCGARLHDLHDPDPAERELLPGEIAELAMRRRRRTAQVVAVAGAVAILSLVVNGAVRTPRESVDVTAPTALVPGSSDEFDEPVNPSADPSSCAAEGCFIGCAPPPSLARPVLWCRDHGGAAAPPVVAGSRVVLVEPGGLVGVERVTGEQRWRIPVGDTISAVPTVTDPLGLLGPLVLVADGINDRLLAVRMLDGETVWRGPPGSDGRATAVGDTILVVGSTGLLSSIDGLTGEAHWQVQTRAPAWRAPLLTADRFVVTLSLDGVETWELTTGTAIWRRTLGLPAFEAAGGAVDDGPQGTVVDGDFPVLGPVIVDDRVVVATAAGSVVELVSSDGTNAWERGFGRAIETAPTANTSRVFALTVDDVLHSIDARTGSRLASTALSGVAGSNRALAADATHVYVTLQDQIRRMDADGLGELDRYDLGRSVVGPPVVSGQTLYVTTRQALYAFDAS